MPAPKLPSFFKQHQAKPFQFTPRYYDERKERIEELRKQYSGERSAPKPGEKRIKFKRNELSTNQWSSSRNKQVQSSNRTLLLIVVALFLATYYLIR
jgi:hypothetical protein